MPNPWGRLAINPRSDGLDDSDLPESDIAQDNIE
jgi:hypothetical protein